MTRNGPSGGEKETGRRAGQEVRMILALIGLAAADVNSLTRHDDHLGPGERRTVGTANHALDPLALLEPGVEDLLSSVVLVHGRDGR